VKWFALWLALAVSYAGGWALARLAGGPGQTTLRQELAAGAVVPAAQLLALAVVALVRRRTRQGRRAGRAPQIPPNQG
jgi:hypothetical protein